MVVSLYTLALESISGDPIAHASKPPHEPNVTSFSKSESVCLTPHLNDIEDDDNDKATVVKEHNKTQVFPSQKAPMMQMEVLVPSQKSAPPLKKYFLHLTKLVNKSLYLPNGL